MEPGEQQTPTTWDAKPGASQDSPSCSRKQPGAGTPPDLLLSVMHAMGPSWWGILKFVSRALRDEVKRLEDRDSTAYSVVPVHLVLGIYPGGGNLLVRWAKIQGCPWTASLCATAAAAGNLSALVWLREAGCPWLWTTCTAAARGGNLRVLQYARGNGCLWDESTCEAAAAGGHLETLMWARKNGAPWNATTCRAAASGGHLMCLQWARAHGCPWDSNVGVEAALGGHVHVLEWGVRRGMPLVQETATAAAKGRHLKALRWLHAKRCPLDPRELVETASQHGDVELIEYVLWMSSTADRGVPI